MRARSTAPLPAPDFAFRLLSFFFVSSPIHCSSACGGWHCARSAPTWLHAQLHNVVNCASGSTAEVGFSWNSAALATGALDCACHSRTRLPARAAAVPSRRASGSVVVRRRRRRRRASGRRQAHPQCAAGQVPERCGTQSGHQGPHSAPGVCCMGLSTSHSLATPPTPFPDIPRDSPAPWRA